MYVPTSKVSFQVGFDLPLTDVFFEMPRPLRWKLSFFVRSWTLTL
jgi:hypothetical protein